VLVRLHGTPVGFVSLAAAPTQTLAARTREAAAATLADAVLAHLTSDDVARSTVGVSRRQGDERAEDTPWAARVACPHRFPDRAEGLSVIICSRNRPGNLRECLDALRKVSYEPVEILVVDNAPSGGATKDLVAAAAAEDPRVRYTCEPRPGLSVARNHGLAVASYELAAFTDDDAIVDPGWPTALAAGFASDPDTVCVTGFVAAGALDSGSERYFDARYTWSEIAAPRQYDLGANRPPLRLYPYRAGVFGTGANFAVRRDAVWRVGGFDPLLGTGGVGKGGEDIDMFLRLILAGGRIGYLPSAFVWHRHRSDRIALGEQIYSYGHGLGAYLAKHLSSPELRLALLRQGIPAAVTMLGRMLRASRVGQFGVGGGRLALTEARGVAAGMLAYRRAAGLPPVEVPLQAEHDGVPR
jgi:GT2 family glycosyltransferase